VTWDKWLFIPKSHFSALLYEYNKPYPEIYPDVTVQGSKVICLPEGRIREMKGKSYEKIQDGTWRDIIWRIPSHKKEN
jgi:hypothetical protein